MPPFGLKPWDRFCFPISPPKIGLTPLASSAFPFQLRSWKRHHPHLPSWRVGPPPLQPCLSRRALMFAPLPARGTASCAAPTRSRTVSHPPGAEWRSGRRLPRGVSAPEARLPGTWQRAIGLLPETSPVRDMSRRPPLISDSGCLSGCEGVTRAELCVDACDVSLCVCVSGSGARRLQLPASPNTGLSAVPGDAVRRGFLNATVPPLCPAGSPFNFLFHHVMASPYSSLLPRPPFLPLKGICDFPGPR